MERLRILLSHPGVAVMVVVFGAAVLAILLAGPLWVWLLVPFGVAAQMLNEYNLHRFVFHLPPPRQQWAFDLLYRAHYGHHDFPTNHTLFFVPIWVSLPMLVVNMTLIWGLLTLLGVGQAFWAMMAIVPVGGVMTFLSYEWFHMTAHLNVKKTRIETYVTKLHNQHHFRDFSRWFHVSPGGEIIDRAMGTAIATEDLKGQQRAAFMRTLGLPPDDARLISARERIAAEAGVGEAEIARAAKA